MVGARAFLAFGAVRILSVVLLAASAGAALGQSAQPAPAQPGGPAPKVTAQRPPLPNAEAIVLLVRTTLLTLNDALRTGNFTVLRDVGAPGFREANSAARLSATFSNLARQKVDLSAVAVIVPQLTEVPAIQPQTGMLRIKGYFPGKPVRIDFNVLYQSMQGRWLLFGLSVQPTPSPARTAAERPPEAAQSAGKSESAKR